MPFIAPPRATPMPTYEPMRAPQATQWQVPRPAPIQQPPLGIARGVSQEPTAPAKFVLPSPQALGVSTTFNLPAAPVAAPVDWNQIQARIERLGVLKYEKERVGPDLIRVRLVLPTADPTLGQPVSAQGATEVAAILLALDQAENWMQKH